MKAFHVDPRRFGPEQRTDELTAEFPWAVDGADVFRECEFTDQPDQLRRQGLVAGHPRHQIGRNIGRDEAVEDTCIHEALGRFRGCHDLRIGVPSYIRRIVEGLTDKVRPCGEPRQCVDQCTMALFQRGLQGIVLVQRALGGQVGPSQQLKGEDGSVVPDRRSGQRFEDLIEDLP